MYLFYRRREQKQNHGKTPFGRGCKERKIERERGRERARHTKEIDESSECGNKKTLLQSAHTSSSISTAFNSFINMKKKISINRHLKVTDFGHLLFVLSKSLLRYFLFFSLFTKLHSTYIVHYINPLFWTQPQKPSWLRVVGCAVAVDLAMHHSLWRKSFLSFRWWQNEGTHQKSKQS